MIPLDASASESVAADLLQQVRWRDGVSCPRCRSDRTVRNGSYGHFQRYLCKDCDRSSNDKTGTVFAHSKIALRKWLFSIYAFLRLNTSLRQLQCEIDVTYKTIHRRVERFAEAFDAPSLDLRSPIAIHELYVSAGLKGCERDRWSRSRPAYSWAIVLELGSKGVPVNTINPGWIEIERTREELDDDYEYTEDIRPVGRLGTPTDVDGLAAFLASDDATFVTGESILIDDGRSQVMQDDPYLKYRRD